MPRRRRSGGKRGPARRSEATPPRGCASSAWDGNARRDRRDRDRIGRGENGGEGKRNRQRNCRDHRVDEHASADDGEHDEAKRQFQDRSAVLNSSSFGIRQPSRKSSGGRKSRKKISGSSSTRRCATRPMTTPSAICTSGRGIARGSMRDSRPLTTTANNRKRTIITGSTAKVLRSRLRTRSVYRSTFAINSRDTVE